MQLFVLTNHCKTKVHCKTCRSKESGRPWRTSLQKMFELPEGNVDFECPWGETWGSSPVIPAPTPEPSKPTSFAAAPVLVAAETTVVAPVAVPATVPQLPKLPANRRARNSGSRGGGCGCGRK